MSDPIIGVFHNAETGETTERELTQKEIDAITSSYVDSPSE